MSRPSRIAGVLAAAFALAPPLSGQLQSNPFGVSAGASLESYTFSDASATGIETIQLFAVPFGADIRIANGLHLGISGAVARGTVSNEAGSEEEVSGLTDTSVRLDWNPTSAVLFSVAGILPTGETEQTLAQAGVSGAIGSDLLPFRISNWGAGGGADASLSASGTSGGTGFGIRVGYRFTSEFTPLEAGQGIPAFKYDPGDQLYARAALDRSLANGGKLSAAVTFQNFSDDATDGSNVLASGQRVQVLTTYAFPWLRNSAAFLYGGVLLRSEGEFVQATTVEGPTSQTVIVGGFGARVRRGSLLWRPALDARVLRTGDGLNQGLVIGAGGSVVIDGGGVRLVPSARFRLGNLVVADGVESTFTGFEVGLSLMLGGGR